MGIIFFDLRLRLTNDSFCSFFGHFSSHLVFFCVNSTSLFALLFSAAAYCTHDAESLLTGLEHIRFLFS